jgi:two-component system, NtrC family, nitrogen regulation response regulator GlnG
MADILVVDDDQSIANAFGHFLSFEGHTYRLASNVPDALEMIAERSPTLIMMDVRMPGVDGLQGLKEIRSRFPGVDVVIMTGYGTSQTSIDAIREGAYDYLTKPLDLDELREIIRKVLAAHRTRPTPDAYTSAEPAAQPVLVGETAAMRDVYKMIGRLATNDVPALVLGEHGTGKRLVIATIHDNSPRRDRPFLAVDCRTLPDAAIEAELFEQATGTVQLAGVDSLPLALQSRLARALAHDGARGGSRLQARVLASSEKDLGELVAAGTFSRELYQTLGVITLRLPPLRDRRDDIPLLVRHFVQRLNAYLNRTILRVDDEVSRLLQEYAWPGNVAELEVVLKRACIVARSDVITTDEIGGLGDSRFPARQDVESTLVRAVRTALQERLVESSGAADASAFHDIIDLVETALVKEGLAITNGNQLKAAAILGVNRATLRKKMPDA